MTRVLRRHAEVDQNPLVVRCACGWTCAYATDALHVTFTKPGGYMVSCPRCGRAPPYVRVLTREAWLKYDRLGLRLPEPSSGRVA